MVLVHPTILRSAYIIILQIWKIVRKWVEDLPKTTVQVSSRVAIKTPADRVGG